ncbi:OmpA family protein [Haliea sp. E1-2-M8]|uniref:OmpA family protein n=1 Tax=Haliea sp. E1-2-M8 TaxID=3064706 RepID=UPI00271896A1|nr:OmpA family protein [Haliea sp. E1-2-M8]MDO8862110.1 OmpA family protein [Haliea sp. E1-2-M8]
MNILKQHLKLPLAVALASLVLAGCTSVSAPEGSAEVRSKLTRLQANQELASRAPVSIKEAEQAVRAAEVPEEDEDLAEHRVFMADRKVDIAAAQAHARLYEDQRVELSKASEQARLDARTREADRARMDAGVARSDAEQARAEARRARDEAALANLEAGVAREDAEAARLKQAELNRQLEELNAKETARGIVITLGDVLFATGRAELTGSAPEGLRKLAAFLGEYPDRSIAIEGHTDSVGTDEFNMGLSQRRADAVQTFLVNQGVAASRMRAVGKGEGSPIASNDTNTGRQQNRRVEVIIEK